MIDDKNENEVKQDSETSERTSEHNHNMVDMLLSKNEEQTQDSETMILETQKEFGALSKKVMNIQEWLMNQINF